MHGQNHIRLVQGVFNITSRGKYFVRSLLLLWEKTSEETKGQVQKRAIYFEEEYYLRLQKHRRVSREPKLPVLLQFD